MEIFEGVLLGLNIASLVWTIMTLTLHFQDTDKEVRIASRIILYFLVIATISFSVYQLGILNGQGITTVGQEAPSLAQLCDLSVLLWLIVLSAYTVILICFFDD
jgi:glucan phosphoethanolaminetransferase (alkaline phosphatase superfamily)